jgi:DNA-binding transcriptional regulator GbsR (MarR family)
VYAAPEALVFASVDEQPDARELREIQQQRERVEDQLASSAVDEEEQLAHQRRAEKASYLRRKLEEREASQRQD